MTLQPLTPDTYLPVELGTPSRQPTNYFCKTLNASDTSTHGGFSILRRAAEKIFPPLDFSQAPPARELIARDLHDVEWKFGTYLEVRVCREKTTGHVYAMKKLKKSEMPRRSQVEHVKVERNLLLEVDSSCIVKLYCSFKFFGLL